MAIPDFQTLMLPVLNAASHGEVKISDVVEDLADQYQLTPEERTQLLPSGRQTRFANRVNWAKSYLNKAGLVSLTRRAHFVITDQGRQLLEHPPHKIDLRLLKQYPSFNLGSNDGTSVGISPELLSEDQSDLTPDEAIRKAQMQLEDDLSDELLSRIRNASPAFFERLVIQLLLSMGYGGTVADMEKSLVGGPNDGGIDGAINQDPLGLDRLYVQAKRYKENNTIGAGDIRDFFGSLDRFKASKGLFVTASTFSKQARETADLLSKRIVLIDGDQLSRLMIKHGVGCEVEETITLKRIDEAFFE